MTDEEYAERLLAEYPGLFKEGAEVWEIPTGWYKLIWDWCKEALILIEQHGLTVRVSHLYAEDSCQLRDEETSLTVNLTESWGNLGTLVCGTCDRRGGYGAVFCSQCGGTLAEVPGVRDFSASLKRLEAETLQACEKCGKEGFVRLDDRSYDAYVLCADHNIVRDHGAAYLGDRIKAWQKSGKTVDAWVEEQLSPYWTPDTD